MLLGRLVCDHLGVRRLDLPGGERVERRSQVVLDEAFCEPGLGACLGRVHAGELAQLPRRGLSAATRRQLAQRSQILALDTGPQNHQAHDPILQCTVGQRREIDTGDGIKRGHGRAGLVLSDGGAAG